jgi:hypothetical protein
VFRRADPLTVTVFSLAETEAVRPLIALICAINSAAVAAYAGGEPGLAVKKPNVKTTAISIETILCFSIGLCLSFLLAIRY